MIQYYYPNAENSELDLDAGLMVRFKLTGPRSNLRMMSLWQGKSKWSEACTLPVYLRQVTVKYCKILTRGVNAMPALLLRST